MEENDEFRKYFSEHGERDSKEVNDGLSTLAHFCYQYHFFLTEEGFDEFQALMLTQDYQRMIIENSSG